MSKLVISKYPISVQCVLTVVICCSCVTSASSFWTKWAVPSAENCKCTILPSSVNAWWIGRPPPDVCNCKSNISRIITLMYITKYMCTVILQTVASVELEHLKGPAARHRLTDATRLIRLSHETRPGVQPYDITNGGFTLKIGQLNWVVSLPV